MPAETRRATEEAKRYLTDVLNESQKQVFSSMREQLQANSPVDTGRLRASWIMSDGTFNQDTSATDPASLERTGDTMERRIENRRNVGDLNLSNTTNYARIVNQREPFIESSVEAGRDAGIAQTNREIR